MDELLDLMEEVLETGENQLGYFPFICKIDGIEEADDRLAWHKPNPSMEYMPILEHQILQDYLEMKKLPSKWGGELRKHFSKERCSQTAMPFFAVFPLYFGLFLSPVQNQMHR